MLKHMGLVVLTVMLTNRSKSDIILNHFKNVIQDWRKNMPKIWYGYIRIYFYRFLKNMRDCRNVNFRNVLSQMVYNPKSLLVASKTIPKIYCINIFQYFSINPLVKLPVGQILFHNSEFSHLGTYNIRVCFPLYWKLNSKFRLNLTFFNIQFFSGVLDGQLDSLTI